MSHRCCPGYRRCVTGRCSKKNPSAYKTAKCKPGYYKCASGKCYRAKAGTRKQKHGKKR